MKFFKILFLVGIIQTVSSQTHTDCNPLIAKCKANPALGKSYAWDFTQGPSNRFQKTSNKEITYNKNGAQFSISKSGDSPTLASEFYIMFGRVKVKAKSAPGIGIVSAIVLISDDLDEIDWEWLGKDKHQVQTNFFSKGDDGTWDRGGYHQVSDTQEVYHTYEIEWTSREINWLINGNLVRTLKNPGNGYYPQTPMQLRIGSWSAGDPSNRKGTIEWAGGLTDYGAGPYDFSVTTVEVQDYSTGSSYSYGDQSGSWTSIQSEGGKISGEKLGDFSAGSIENSSKEEMESVEKPDVSEPSDNLKMTMSFVSIQSVGTEIPSMVDDGKYRVNPKFDDGMYDSEKYSGKKAFKKRSKEDTQQANSSFKFILNNTLLLICLLILLSI